MALVYILVFLSFLLVASNLRALLKLFIYKPLLLHSISESEGNLKTLLY